MSEPTTWRRMDDAHLREATDVAAALGADRQHGLDDREAERRLRDVGANELRGEPPVPAWRRFLAQFQDALVLLLLAATAISAALWLHEGDSALPYEAIAILMIVILNAVMGHVQESRAASAVAALQRMSAAEATVVRAGRRLRVPAATVVPGDVILLEEGDAVPADARLVESTALKTSEAALTGESLPVSKSPAPLAGGEVALGNRANSVFSGTAVTYGRGRAIVTATGMRTEMGRIAGLLERTVDERTPLQRELDRIGRVLGGVVVVIAAVMIVTIVLVADVREAGALVDVLILGVALAVAAVPEGLPAVVTAVLSIGVQRMARRNAIVRHLSAVETLGSASVIASDKTGTLTRNEMTVRLVVTASGSATFGGTGYEPAGAVEGEGGGEPDAGLRLELERALVVADRANNAELVERDGRWSVQGDPTEGALLVAARKAGLDDEALDERLPRVGEIPFSSERKRMSTIHQDVEADAAAVLFVKGAPDVLLERCAREVVGDGTRALTDARRREIADANERLADRALRTLGLATRALPARAVRRDAAGAFCDDVERDLDFVGLVGMMDPPRAEAASAVGEARAAGVRTLMITGDHPRTAAVIAREIGISTDGRAVTGVELARLDDRGLDEVVADVSVFARVDPEHKLRIVDALRRGGAVVAMTGDGVNDAPALRSADIGIAMGITGTDVSRAAADIVLADDDYATIVAAVEEGRAIFSNIRKFLRFLLSSNIGEVLTMFLGVVLADVIGLSGAADGALVLPLLATQVLWINLVTDGAPALALGLDPAEHGLMRRPPRPAGEPVITMRMWRGIALVGLVMAAGTLFVLDLALPGGLVEGTGTLRHAQSMAFTTLVLFQLFNTLNARSDERSAFSGAFANRWLWGSIGLSVALQLLVLELPALQQAFGTTSLAASDWVVCAAVASSVLWVREGTKLVARARRSG